MKIFNWVHRRFHHKDEVGQDAKKAETFIGIDNDKLALLENAALAGVFDGWREGILAVGTLGIDLLKDLKPKYDDCAYEISPDKENERDNEVLFVGDEIDKEDQEEEMEYPLILRASKHGFDDDQKHDGSQFEETAKLNVEEDVGEKDSIDKVKRVRKSGERITLADLLWADSEQNLLKKNKLCDDDQVKTIQYDDGGAITEPIKKHNDANDDWVCLISEKKKKKLAKDDSARSIKKINQLMRKMLKRKVHPDIGSQKKDAREMKPFNARQSVVSK